MSKRAEEPAAEEPAAAEPAAGVAADAAAGAPPERVPWGVLIRYARPEARTLAIAGALSLIITAVALVTPLVVQDVLDRVNSGRPTGPVLWVIVGLFAVEAVLGTIQSFLLGRSGEGIVRAMRGRMVHRLLHWPMAAHDRHRSGDLISRVNSDTSQVRVALASSLTETLTGVLTFVGALLLMLVIDPLMLALTLGCVAVAAVAVFVTSIRVMVVTLEAQRRLGGLSAGLERVLRAVRTVKLSGAEQREESALGEEIEGAYRAGVRQAKLEALIQPVTSLAVQGALVLVLTIGGARLASGSMELGALVAFLLYLLYLVVPISTLFMSVTDLQAGRAALARVEEIVAEPLEHEDAEPLEHDDAMPAEPDDAVRDRTAEPREPPAVRLRSVSFAYPTRPGEQTLQDVDLDISAGSRLALVGPSGAGKSTIFALIERLYDADEGTVAVLGRDVRAWSLNDLRAVIGHVEQEAPVMAGTLHSNVTYAKPDATDAEIDDALRSANLDTFVASLPHGLQTCVGDGGLTLSGGERQRVAIARMLLKAPRILLLDEVTSQLDGRSERLLKQALDEVARRCTVVVIAHRLSTVRDADAIVVVEDGRIRARGTHEELLTRDALYLELANTQLVDSAEPASGTAASAQPIGRSV
jgi:ABC-type multidrug transport system fused ATPase/permease subunit